LVGPGPQSWNRLCKKHVVVGHRLHPKPEEVEKRAGDLANEGRIARK